MQRGFEDRFGVDLGTTSAKAAQLYSEGVDLALSRNFGSDAKYLAAIEEDEGFATAYASLAVLRQHAGQQQEARQAAERAAELARSQSRRVQGYADTVALWVGGEGRKAYERVREHLREYPNDAMALNAGHRLLVMGCGAAGVPNYPPELLESAQECGARLRRRVVVPGQLRLRPSRVGPARRRAAVRRALAGAAAGQRQRLPLCRARVLRARRPCHGPELPGRVDTGLRQAGSVLRTLVLAPRAVPACAGPLPERAGAVRRRHTPVGCFQEHELHRR